MKKNGKMIVRTKRNGKKKNGKRALETTLFLISFVYTGKQFGFVCKFFKVHVYNLAAGTIPRKKELNND